MYDELRSVVFLFFLLNPFLVIIYLVDVVAKLETQQFRRVLIRAGCIASAVFCTFAVLGDTIFSDLFQAEFASFQIFGGVVFILIGVQFVFKGPTAIELLRGESSQLAGVIAMPVLIGPGTLSASVMVGERHEPAVACLIVLVAVFLSIALMLGLKSVHDLVRTHRALLIERYVEVAGRITALYVGTVATDMVMQGLRSWVAKF